MSLVITIGGSDKSDYIELSSIRKTDAINSNPDVLEFKIRQAGTKNYKPSLNDEVIMTRSGTKIFGGVITRIKQTVEGAKNIAYLITCNDYVKYLNRQLVTNRYEGDTVEDIITDIVASYSSGFTVNNVDCPIEIDSVAFNRLKIGDCIQKLADLVSYSWYVDYDKDIHFFPKNNETAPFNLTDDSGNYIYESLEHLEDLSQIRNKILVEGGEVEGEERTITRDGSEVSDEGVLDLQYKFAEKPTVLVNSVAQTIGVDFLDDDASYDAMWSYQQKYLRWTSGNEPTGGDTIEVTGNPLYPIVVNVPNPDSINSFGVYEHTIKDKTIRSQNEALERAFAEIEAYANSLVEGTFRTNTDGLRSGMIINIQSTIRNIDEDVLIQRVVFRPVTPDGSRNIYEVRYATLKTLGIIEFLQNRLRERELTEDEVETLLSFLQLEDTVTPPSDQTPTATTSTGPYKWGAFNWGFGAWNA